jgi:fatty acid desaturase
VSAYSHHCTLGKLSERPPSARRWPYHRKINLMAALAKSLGSTNYEAAASIPFVSATSICWLVPAWLAGSMQSIRKYVEHMGLTGSSAESSSRSIAPSTWLSRLSVYSLFHIGHHAVHHRYPKIPQDRLSDLQGSQNSYPNYRSALVAMLLTLPDPKVGSQWELASSSRPR